jgi:excisionase family DNA binding protein
MIDLFTTDRQFLRVDEVADLLSVSRRTVCYWVTKGQIASVCIGGSYRVSVADLRAKFKHATAEPRKRSQHAQPATAPA